MSLAWPPGSLAYPVFVHVRPVNAFGISQQLHRERITAQPPPIGGFPRISPLLRGPGALITGVKWSFQYLIVLRWPCFSWCATRPTESRPKPLRTSTNSVYSSSCDLVFFEKSWRCYFSFWMTFDFVRRGPKKFILINTPHCLPPGKPGGNKTRWVLSFVWKSSSFCTGVGKLYTSPGILPKLLCFVQYS